MPAEEVQEIGREGAATLKRWLEATTYIELPFDAYNNKIDCMVETFGGMKQFDLVGYLIRDKKPPVVVESKRYASAGGQYKEFKKFLAIAYAADAKEVDKFSSCRRAHYYWVTFHPFNLENWSKFETYDHVKMALEENPEYLDGHAVDDALVHDVASRITVLVFNPKQEALALTRTELEQIRPVLNRKVKTL
ncbi:hypothetical protein [Georgenia sp. Marseille-Q6866]